MTKVKRVYKFGTGHPIPEGAVYLSTIKQTEEIVIAGDMYARKETRPCWYVWHYFLVETE